MTALRIGSLILMMVAPVAYAQDATPLITTVVTPNPVTEGESVQLRIEVEASQSVIVFQPSFDAPDFILVGSQPNYGGMRTRSYVNGQSTFTQKSFFEYVLSPKKAGTLTIKDIKVKVGTREVRTPNIMVKVLPDTSPRRPSPPQEDDESANPASPSYGGGLGGASRLAEDTPSSFNSDFTVFAAVSKKKVYVGEPIVVEYWIYDFGALRQLEVQKWPTFKGFWKEDLEIATRFNFDELYVGDQLARRAFLSRYALYGIKPGKITLDKLTVRGQYVSRGTVQGFFQTQEYRTGVHSSQEVAVEILPLPAEGRPAKFSGAVGHFTLKVDADKTTVAQNTPVTFTVTLQGEGNFQSIESIRLPLPADFEVYESKTGARGATPLGMRRDLESQKTFQITAVPRKAGNFRVEPLEWSYFDPNKGVYQKLSTAAIDLQVTENTGVQASNTYATPDAAASAPPPGVQVLAPLKSVDLEKVTSFAWLNALLGALVGFAAWLGFAWLRAKIQGYVSGVLEDPLAEAKREWGRAKVAKDNSWPSSLEDSLFAVGEALLGSNPRGITRTDFEQQWREHRLPAPLFHRISLVLDKLDRQRFGSGSTTTSDRTQLSKEVEGILKEAAGALPKKSYFS